MEDVEDVVCSAKLTLKCQLTIVPRISLISGGFVEDYSQLLLQTQVSAYAAKMHAPTA